jgi:hypothetical protein
MVNKALNRPLEDLEAATGDGDHVNERGRQLKAASIPL